MLKLNLFGGFTLTAESGDPIALRSRKAMGLLAYLATPPDTPRSREDIMALLWSDRGNEQARGSLRQLLSALRKDLGEDVLRIDNHMVTLSSDQVHLVPSEGGLFLAGLEIKDEGFEDWVRDQRMQAEEGTHATPATTEELDDPTIAVLPFRNMSSDPDQDFFSDGITQDIITELSRFNNFYVIAPRSSFQFKDSTMSAEEIGRELEADFILEGSVRRAGDRVRITVQLTDVEEDTQVWGDRYDRELQDVFAIQEEVARDVATAVPGKIASLTYAWVDEHQTQNPTAYEYLMKGESLLWNEQGADKARRFFERAIAADEGVARAYANLALLRSNEVIEGLADFEAIRTEVRDLSDKALNNDSEDPVLMILVATAYLNVGEHKMAERCLDSALKLNPNHFYVLLFGAYVSAWLGKTEQSLKLLERYFRHNAQTYRTDAEIAFFIYFMAARFDDAIAALAQRPRYSLHNQADLAAALALAGRLSDAHEMRASFEASATATYGLPEIYDVRQRLIKREETKALWRKGYQEAGFELEP